VLHILADAKRFPRAAETLLQLFEDGDASGRVVRSVEVPGQEAGEVLDGSERLVATDCGSCMFSEGCADEAENAALCLPVVATKRLK
jgi:hypothetical protein